MVRVVSQESDYDMEAIDERISSQISLAEVRIVSQIKVWFMTGLLGLFATSITGFAVMLFYMGQLSERFDTAIRQVGVHSTSLTNRGAWMVRKDAIDDDLIRWAREKGYTPPEWYEGQDAGVTGR